MAKYPIPVKRRDDAFVGQGAKPMNKLPPIKEESLPHSFLQAISRGDLQEGTRLYSMGQCSIIVSPPIDPEWGWHLSISHPTRYPSWDEVANARYELLSLEADFEMVLPRPEDYISIHANCFQMWEAGKKRSVR